MNSYERNIKYQVKIGGIACSFCKETIEKACRMQRGVQSVHVSLSHEEALVVYDPAITDKRAIDKTLNDMGYTVRSPENVKAFEEQQEELKLARKHLAFALVLTLISLGLMILMWSGIRQVWFRWIMLILALSTMFGPGRHIKKKAWQSLKRGILNQHNLLEFGAFSGLVGGFLGFFNPQFPIADFFAVSVFVTTYHILSAYVSMLVRTKASDAVRKLLELQPETATTISNGIEVLKTVNQLKIGDIVRVRPGERIPIDGMIIRGESTVDESIITGESIPVDRKTGNNVVGGSVNLYGSIDLEVTRIGEKTFLQQIARHVEESRALKPGILIIVDRVLRVFVPVVLLFAVGAFLFWTVGSYFLFGSFEFNKAVFSTLAVLVMGYPCALGMSMPLALIRGSGIAAKQGILMRSGEAFQIFQQIDKFVLDKTGTITKGKPEVIEVTNYDYDKNKVLSLLATAEMLSEHPIARAIINYIDNNNIIYKEPQNFMTFSGEGTKSKLGKDILIVGKSSFIKDSGITISESQLEKIEKLSMKGNTVIIMGVNSKIIGIIALADKIKEDAIETIKEIKRNNIEPIMITGDNQNTAESIALQVGIEKFHADILPEEKSEKIREMQKQGFKVAMVGDGINDAPALMQADVGIAIGAGTDIAIESSDIIITGQKLNKIMVSYYIAKKSYNKTKQNLFLAFMFNGIGVPAAATGLVSPVWAMIAMAASVSAVLLNSFGFHFRTTTRRE